MRWHVLGSKQLTDVDFRWSLEVINRQIAIYVATDGGSARCISRYRHNQNRTLEKTRIALDEIIDDVLAIHRSSPSADDHAVI